MVLSHPACSTLLRQPREANGTCVLFNMMRYPVQWELTRWGECKQVQCCGHLGDNLQAWTPGGGDCGQRAWVVPGSGGLTGSAGGTAQLSSDTSQGASRQHATRGPPTEARGAANQPSPADGAPARPGSSRRLTRRRWACFIHGPSSSARNQDTKSPAERGGATRPGTIRTS